MSHKYNLKCSSVTLLLSEYVDNRLSAEEVENIKDHLNNCESCSIKYRNLVSMRDMILSTYMPKENVDFSSSIMAKINSKPKYVQEKVSKDKAVHLSERVRQNKNEKLKKNIINKIMFTLSIAATIVISISSTIMYLENNRVENSIGTSVASSNEVNNVASNVSQVSDEEYSAYDQYVIEHFASTYDNLTPTTQPNVRSVNFEK